MEVEVTVVEKAVDSSEVVVRAMVMVMAVAALVAVSKAVVERVQV